MKTLKDVEIGDRAVVVRLHGEGAVRRRILDMGLGKGTEAVVRKVAPSEECAGGQPQQRQDDALQRADGVKPVRRQLAGRDG